MTERPQLSPASRTGGKPSDPLHGFMDLLLHNKKWWLAPIILLLLLLTGAFVFWVDNPVTTAPEIYTLF